MSAVTDFRNSPLRLTRVDSCGRDIGRRSYWKLYAIENLLRVIIHSILSVEIRRDWWKIAADPTLQANVEGFKALYAAKPRHSKPGNHEIYYTFLTDLNKLMAAHRHLFVRHIPDIDEWVERVELVRLPRNIVGHMNWPHAADRALIDELHDHIQALVTNLSRTGSSVALVIPL